jgi:hypothetical protein
MWPFSYSMDDNMDWGYLKLCISDLEHQITGLNQKIYDLEHKPDYVNIDSYKRIKLENLRIKVYIHILESMLGDAEVKDALAEFRSTVDFIEEELQRQYIVDQKP